MPRYPHLDPAPGALATITGAGAPVLNLYRILANHGALLDAWLAFAYALRAQCALPRGLREACILLTACWHDCAYEELQHQRMARAAGLAEVKIAALARTSRAHWQDCPAFDAPERAALALTEAMLNNRVTEAVHQRAAALFSPAERIELVLTIGFYVMVPRVLQAIDARAEGEEDAEGAAECERAIAAFERQLLEQGLMSASSITRQATPAPKKATVSGDCAGSIVTPATKADKRGPE